MLSEHQLSIIENALIQFHVFNQPVRNELLDHVCCMVEAEMHPHTDFETALDKVFNTFNEDEMREIQLEKLSFINQNQRIMYKLSLLTLFVLLFVTVYVWATPIYPPKIAPLENHFKISSGFGMRMHPYKKVKKMHTGIDLKAPTGTPVLATADAIVIKVVPLHEKHGNYIMLKHDDQYQTKYSHLSSIEVKEGERIQIGQMIGKVGSTGLSTAPHLHYEVLKDGEPVDPEHYMGKE